METSRDSVNVFLVLSMLGISARFTPQLCERFNGSKNASEFFLDVAHILIADEMWKTTLENAQAFFLLGMADWGRGDRDRSAINMGIAVRMAAIMRLHREETYSLPPNASADQVVDVERARRTFWVIQNHDNLYTQQHLPRSFSKSDITALLPCNESDFAFGRMSPHRAALSGTRPAQKDPSLMSLRDRSLFATLVQAHDLWGTIARDASRDDSENVNMVEVEPWHPESHYSQMTMFLASWEESMPPEHRWSAWNLRGYKAEHVDLAYLSIVTITRLNNIVLRRAYLDRVGKETTTTDAWTRPGAAPAGFWDQASFELFTNAWSLFEAVDVWYSLRSAEDGFPAMLAFCIYICGSLAFRLDQRPGLCPRFNPTPSAKVIVHRSLEVLSTLEDKWSTASQWSSLLRKALTSHDADQTQPHENGNIEHHIPANRPRPLAQRVSRSVGSSPTVVEPEPQTYSTFRSPLSEPARITTMPPLESDLSEMETFSTRDTLSLGAIGQQDSQSLQPRIFQPFSLLSNDIPNPASSNLDPLLYTHPLDIGIDFADVIQGYINLGWTA